MENGSVLSNWQFLICNCLTVKGKNCGNFLRDRWCERFCMPGSDHGWYVPASHIQLCNTRHFRGGKKMVFNSPQTCTGMFDNKFHFFFATIHWRAEQSCPALVQKGCTAHAASSTRTEQAADLLSGGGVGKYFGISTFWHSVRAWEKNQFTVQIWMNLT